MNKFILIKFFNLLLILTSAISEKNWMYEMTSVTTKTSNADLIDIQLSVERVKRGEYALSGKFYMNLDIAEDDDNEVELVSFRSANSDGDYKSIPFEMSRRHFYDALNNHYKDVIMETLKDCSDLPYFKDKAPVPFEKKTYTLDKCKFTQEGLPNLLETGTYKILLLGYGDVEWEVEVIVEVEQDS